MTILGDLAQSTTPAGQQDWDVALRHLGGERAEVAAPDDRLPCAGPILDVANRLLPLTGVDATASRSVRWTATRRRCVIAADGRLAEAVAARSTTRAPPPPQHRRRRPGRAGTSGSPPRWRTAGLRAVDHVHDLGRRRGPAVHARRR